MRDHSISPALCLMAGDVIGSSHTAALNKQKFCVVKRKTSSWSVPVSPSSFSHASFGSVRLHQQLVARTRKAHCSIWASQDRSQHSSRGDASDFLWGVLQRYIRLHWRAEGWEMNKHLRVSSVRLHGRMESVCGWMRWREEVEEEEEEEDEEEEEVFFF